MRTSRYPTDFRQRAVDMARNADRPLSHLARELGINHETLRSWVRRAHEREGRPTRLTDEERAELVRLRKENAELRLENVMLARAAANRRPATVYGIAAL